MDAEYESETMRAKSNRAFRSETPVPGKDLIAMGIYDSIWENIRRPYVCLL